MSLERAVNKIIQNYNLRDNETIIKQKKKPEYEGKIGFGFRS